jgi:hypothetical protein
MKDMFDQLIKEGKSNKIILLDMLEEVKKRNTENNIVISDDEYNEIKAEIEAMPN